jgi:hypothetical protein
MADQWLSPVCSKAVLERFILHSKSRSRSPEKEIAQLLNTAEVMPYISVLWDPTRESFVCWEGHDLHIENAVSTRKDGFICDFCGRIVAVAHPGFAHCKTCDQDICRECLSEIQRNPRFHRPCWRCSACGRFELTGLQHCCSAVAKPVHSPKQETHSKEGMKDPSTTRIVISGLNAEGVAQLCAFLENQQLPIPERIAPSIVNQDGVVAYFADPLQADEFFECVAALKAKGHPQATAVTLRWR